ncbi:MAG: GTPase, partial [Sphingobium phenoxybenzoativorans]
LSASVEAALDFSDEDDVPDAGIEARIKSGIAGLADTLQRELARPDAERLRDGVRVVLAGPPNAGKSTLLNALVGRDAAIVSDIAGTTRDRIEAPAAIGGIPFLFTDTAGLRADKQDAIEAIGMARAEQAIAAADILLWMGDPADAPRDDAVKISAKKDVAGWQAAAGTDLDLSAISGEGMAELVALLLQRARGLVPGEGDYALHARQRREVEAALAALSGALETDDLLIVAEHLRLARRAMDALTGRAGTEDMLNALFGKFCIGK